MNRNKQRN